MNEPMHNEKWNAIHWWVVPLKLSTSPLLRLEKLMENIHELIMWLLNLKKLQTRNHFSSWYYRYACIKISQNQLPGWLPLVPPPGIHGHLRGWAIKYIVISPSFPFITHSGGSHLVWKGPYLWGTEAPWLNRVSAAFCKQILQPQSSLRMVRPPLKSDGDLMRL